MISNRAIRKVSERISSLLGFAFYASSSVSSLLETRSRGEFVSSTSRIPVLVSSLLICSLATMQIAGVVCLISNKIGRKTGTSIPISLLASSSLMEVFVYTETANTLTWTKTMFLLTAMGSRFVLNSIDEEKQEGFGLPKRSLRILARSCVIGVFSAINIAVGGWILGTFSIAKYARYRILVLHASPTESALAAADAEWHLALSFMLFSLSAGDHKSPHGVRLREYRSSLATLARRTIQATRAAVEERRAKNL